MTCKAAKEAFVATIKVGVGPGVNIELNRLVRKVAIEGSAANAPLEVEETGRNNVFGYSGRS